MGTIGKIVLGTALALAPKVADAGLIDVFNYSPNINNCDMFVQNVNGASELSDGFDSDFFTSPIKPALEIYAKPFGTRLSTNALPKDTLGSDMILGVNAPVANAGNSLVFQVTDNTDLTDVVAYDTANPGTKYPIATDGSMTWVGLPDLVNQPAGEYATWRLQLREASAPIPEPEALSLLALALLASRKKRR